MDLSQRVLAVKPSVTLEIAAKAKAIARFKNWDAATGNSQRWSELKAQRQAMQEHREEIMRSARMRADEIVKASAAFTRNRKCNPGVAGGSVAVIAAVLT